MFSITLIIFAPKIHRIIGKMKQLTRKMKQQLRKIENRKCYKRNKGNFTAPFITY